MLKSQEKIQAQVQAEKLLKVKKQVKYRDTAQVRLERLFFKDSKKLEKKNIKRLKANFHKDCC